MYTYEITTPKKIIYPNIIVTESMFDNFSEFTYAMICIL